MTSTQGPDLHPRRAFFWWDKQRAPETQRESNTRKSAREKFREFFFWKLKEPSFVSRKLHKRRFFNRLFFRGPETAAKSTDQPPGWPDDNDLRGTAIQEASEDLLFPDLEAAFGPGQRADQVPTLTLDLPTSDKALLHLFNLRPQSQLGASARTEKIDRRLTLIRRSRPHTGSTSVRTKSLATSSENRSLLRKIRLRWLQNQYSDRSVALPTEYTSTRRMIPQLLLFLKAMYPAQLTTELNVQVR